MLDLVTTFFTATEFDSHFDFSTLDKTVEECCRTACEHPKAFYLFMQRYTHFNGSAGSLVARLASSIGLSRSLFREPGCAVNDEADRGMEVAAKVLAATIDEHSDKHHRGFPHRTLAQATLKAVGDYAGLSPQEKNEIAKIPHWLSPLLTASVEGYQGVPGNFGLLTKAMGVHAASEILADREYTVIDKVVRHEKSGIGFDKYLRDTNGQVYFCGANISSWYWISAHGNYHSSGLEKEHSEAALDALNLAVKYSDQPQSQMRELVFAGFRDFVGIQQTFFFSLQKECLEIVKNELFNLMLSAS